MELPTYVSEPKISGDIPEVTVSGDRRKTASTITKTSPLKWATLAVFHFPCAFEQPIGRRRNIPRGLVTFLVDISWTWSFYLGKMTPQNLGIYPTYN